MAISIFPSTAAEFVSNNFVIDMNDSTNNTADTGGVKQAGPYSMSFSSGDTSFDVYLINEDGNSVGYSNNTSIVASGLFSTVLILGVAQDEVVSFLYQGSVNNADGEGDEPGAGAYLESISPADLPSIDDTATVTGGNFGADTEITFESGATVLPAKSITVLSGTELLVTRPDGLIEDEAPYTLRAVTTGVPQPTGTNANILTDAVTAGADPTWVTTSPLNLAPPNQAFSQTLEATDTEGTVVDYSVVAGTLTTGLTLDASTGVLSGTSTANDGDVFTFTVRATDDGGNTTDREFTQTVALAQGGTVTTDANFQYHTFTAGDDFSIAVQTNVEYLIVAGGAGGGGGQDGSRTLSGGGGGAGGLLNGTATALSPGNYVVTVGAGGGRGGRADSGNPGGNSTFSGIGTTAIGGGPGAGTGDTGGDGGSGGGGAPNLSLSTSVPGGSGTAGQGNDGGFGRSRNFGEYGTGGGGGGAGSAGGNAPSDGDANQPIPGGDGLFFNDWATATGIGSGEFATGGEGGAPFSVGQIGGPANTGAGGGGAAGNDDASASAGRDGVVIVRFAI